MNINDDYNLTFKNPVYFSLMKASLSNGYLKENHFAIFKNEENKTGRSRPLIGVLIYFKGLPLFIPLISTIKDIQVFGS